MRKQYHFRKVGKDTLIWDVDKLSGLVQSQEVVEVPLEDIKELDEAFWYGAPGDIPTCRSVAGHAKLIEATDLEFPIILCPDGRVMDGMHRVCKALNMGRSSIKAQRLVTLPEPDFKNVSAEKLPYDS